MLSSMTKTLAAFGLSLALGLSALGATATPARADADDAARIIGGLIALYAIGRALEGNSHQPRAQIQYYTPNTIRLVAPARCRVQGHGFHGYLRSCMLNHARYPDYLPSNCLRQINTNHGVRYAFASPCLGRHGWVHG